MERVIAFSKAWYIENEGGNGERIIIESESSRKFKSKRNIQICIYFFLKNDRINRVIIFIFIIIHFYCWKFIESFIFYSSNWLLPRSSQSNVLVTVELFLTVDFAEGSIRVMLQILKIFLKYVGERHKGTKGKNGNFPKGVCYVRKYRRSYERYASGSCTFGWEKKL